MGKTRHGAFARCVPGESGEHACALCRGRPQGGPGRPCDLVPLGWELGSPTPGSRRRQAGRPRRS
eukprot:5942340-Alexandrium_andersonii.AAC.1